MELVGLDDQPDAPPTLVCESFDCMTHEGVRRISPSLVPTWNGRYWRYRCPKCKADYGFKPHPDLPDLSEAKLAR